MAAASSPASLPPEPRLVRVTLGPQLPLRALLEAGLDVVEVRGGRECLVFEWPGDDRTLEALGAAAELEDAAPGRSAARRAHEEWSARPAPRGKRVSSAIGPAGEFRVQSPPPFGAGSMGGYWTLDEVRMKLDDLVASDADSVVADQLDTLGTTVLGRPILGLRIGRAVSGPDPRPVAFFSALTHAREPGGMQSLFYFVDDLLSGYGTDPFKTSLLDHRVVYIVPVVNPDGYQLNVNTYTATGGASFGNWRKNARDNDNNGSHSSSNDGVDLNRNYGYKWNYNNVGSSGSFSSQTYRGPSAFSEPETRAQRDRAVLLQPKTGLAFHTYSDLFLHPWGWTAAAAPDSELFYELNDECTLGIGYQSGPAPRVLYEVNGEFNDWCYGDTLLKPRYFSWTPEAGSGADGFWPPPSRITPIARENLRSCYTLAAAAGAYVRLENARLAEGSLPAGNLAHLAVRARNLGLAGTAAPLTAWLVSLDPGAVVLEPGPIAYPALGPRQSGDATAGAMFEIAARDSVTPGRLVRFRIEFVTAEGEYSRDTVEVAVGVPTVLATDGASGGLAQWSAGGSWGVVSNDPRHPSLYFADSPAGNYAASVNAALIRKSRLDLSSALHAYAIFESRWNLESDYDGEVVEASLDSVTWTPLRGRASVSGLFSPQPANGPVYEGARWRWREERVDLSPFAGPTAGAVRFRFRTVADGGAQFDGFNFDSLRIVLYDTGAQPAPVAVGAAESSGLEFAPPAPNPARGQARFVFSLPAAGEARLEVFDLAGRRVRLLHDGALRAQRYVFGWDLRDDGGRPVSPGLYLAHLSTEAGHITRRLAVLR